MTKKIKNYKKSLDLLLEEDRADTDWDALSTELTEKIRFYQHERLVHLIVTMAVSIMLVLCVLAAFLATEITPVYIVLIAMFFVLDFPYLIYYFMIENAVQDIYSYYDKIRSKRRT